MAKQEDIYSSDTLLVKHLPSGLSIVEKEELLQHFGALRVKVMGSRGQMKHTAFATFRDKKATEKALSRLHQLEILGCRLIVEYANKKQQKHFPTLLDDKSKSKTDKQTAKVSETEVKTEQSENKSLPEDDLYKKWCLDYPRNPTLYYVYPQPTVSIITNITNTLASHPKFYVQVLHLMNKMNLPAPFGPVTCTPPIPVDDTEDTLGEDIIQQEEMEVSSEEESEIDSDGDTEKLVSGQPAVKRTIKRKSNLPHKRPKVTALLKSSEPIMISQGPVMSTKEIFEQPSTQVSQKKIQLRLPEAVSTTSRASTLDLLHVDQEKPETDLSDISSVINKEFGIESGVESGGFGKFEPTEKPEEEIMCESELPYTIDSSQFLSQEQLKKGRITQKEMKNFSVFKNYEAGEPTSRLYIKNLAKQTTEQDLVNIFGQYINWTSELEKNMFDIRLMKEGRMKGQAFITFPSEDKSLRALQDTNGYVINSKPMAVQFARSAKAKEITDSKRGKK